ncbi:MAG: hypothetical protein NTW04_00870 [Elusimicrobia bacterium]|nr:hypothetical protein [Elusimicrobiota bacterium]
MAKFLATLLLAFFCAHVGFCQTAVSDRYVVTLKSGKKIYGSVKDVSETSIKIKTSNGEMALDRKDIASIKPTSGKTAGAKAAAAKPLAKKTPPKSVMTEERIIPDFAVAPKPQPVLQPAPQVAPPSPAPSATAKAAPAPEKEKPPQPQPSKPPDKAVKYEFSIRAGMWKPAFKLDVGEIEKGTISLSKMSPFYGARFLQKITGGLWGGAEASMSSFAARTDNLTLSSVKTSGQLLMLNVVLAYKPEGEMFYLAAGGGMGFLRLNYKADFTPTPANPDPESAAYSLSENKPIMFAATGLEKKFSDITAGVELSYGRYQAESPKLTLSKEGFFEAALKLSWGF